MRHRDADTTGTEALSRIRSITHCGTPGQCRARSESYSFIFQVKNETGKRRIILKYRRSRNRLIDTEDKVIVARWKGLGGLDDKGSGIKKHKWTVTATGTESTAEETRSVL